MRQRLPIAFSFPTSGVGRVYPLTPTETERARWPRMRTLYIVYRMYRICELSYGMVVAVAIKAEAEAEENDQGCPVKLLECIKYGVLKGIQYPIAWVLLFAFADGHTLVTFSQLRSWGECPTWEGFNVSSFIVGGETLSFSSPCDYFSTGKVKATTLSLSVLVAIEMFNSLNALSEDNSLLTMPPWTNPWLLLALSVSFGLHFLVLYVPFLASIFGVVPLSLSEWCLVVIFSFPVILIDEILKLIGRKMSRRHQKYKTV